MGLDAKNVPLTAEVQSIEKELADLVEIIKKDKQHVMSNGGSKVGLILGLILTLGAVIGTFGYILKKRSQAISEFDEGGEAEDRFVRV